MLRAQESVTVHRPAEDVFRFMTDLENDVTWRSEVRSASVIGDTQREDYGVGTSFRERLDYQGNTADAIVVVTAFEPGRHAAFKADDGDVHVRGFYDFQPKGVAETEVKVTAEVELTGNLAKYEGLIGEALGDIVGRDVRRLRTTVEQMH